MSTVGDVDFRGVGKQTALKPLGVEWEGKGPGESPDVLQYQRDRWSLPRTPQGHGKDTGGGVGAPRCQVSRNILLTHWDLWLSPDFPCAVEIAPARCFQGTLVNSVNQVLNIYAQSVLEEGTIYTKPEIHPLIKTRILLEWGTSLYTHQFHKFGPLYIQYILFSIWAGLLCTHFFSTVFCVCFNSP